MKTAKCKNCEIEFTYEKGKRLFCSKKCSKKYFNIIEKQKSKKANGWIPKSIINKEKKASAKETYLDLSKTHLKIKDIEEKYKILFQSYEYFCKKELNIAFEPLIINISYINNQWNGGVTKFYSSEVLKYIDLYTSDAIPDGYVRQEYILKNLNICSLTFWEYVKRFGDIEGKYKYRNCPIYPKNKTDEWIFKVPLLVKESYDKYKVDRKQASIQKNIIKKELQKEKSVRWKQEIKERREQERREIEARKLARSLLPKKDGIIRREDDWTSWENYEARLRTRLSDSLELAKIRSQKSINVNLHYHSEHDSGNIICLSCKKCNLSKPYYDFHFSQSMSSGRNGICKECARAGTNKNKPTDKQKDSNQFLIQLATSIKGELSKKNGKYYEIKIKKIWEALPYTKQELLEHVQKHMQPWMDWSNNRRAAPGVKTWHLDHIKPKASFQYTSMEDEEFQKCWSLSNLRPIEAFVNIIKSDHREIQSVVSAIFRGCVVHKRNSKFWSNYFNYTPEEARKYLEKQFTEGLLWSNYNKIWEIDHIIPRAALPFNSVTDENFKKLWSLENLRPALLTDNRSKTSKYEDKKYFAFDTPSVNMVSIDPNLATG